MAALDYIHIYQLPRDIVRNRPFTPSAVVTDATGVDVALSAGTYALYAGSKQIYTTSTLTYTPTGTVATTAAISAATTADESLSDRWLETWDVTVDGESRTFDRPCYLIRRELHMTLTDTDLLSRHTDLAELRDSDQTTYTSQRGDAWVTLMQWLIQKGNRPQLIIDDWQLRPVHRSLTLELIFTDFALSVGDGRYKELAERYRVAALAEFDALALTYDFDEDGFIDSGEVSAKTANPVTNLMVPYGWNL